MPKAVFAGQEGASQLARHALEKVTFLQAGGSAHTTAIKSSLGRHLLSQHPPEPFFRRLYYDEKIHLTGTFFFHSRD